MHRKRALRRSIVLALRRYNQQQHASSSSCHNNDNDNGDGDGNDAQHVLRTLPLPNKDDQHTTTTTTTTTVDHDVHWSANNDDNGHYDNDEDDVFSTPSVDVFCDLFFWTGAASAIDRLHCEEDNDNDDGAAGQRKRRSSLGDEDLAQLYRAWRAAFVGRWRRHHYHYCYSPLHVLLP